ncbi:hypothetical protein JZK55_15020 [Dissulfurispira thermophila]|uniref:Uncharacterized protein n=1 Tax=Dissulfurispira thermophila TaxID=2715679 RepID=A0A7G1H187_9BACT|nr:hypothetical protein [Dissulfurispira thermophila]BCB96580.1 hypothetical protein JZK55_15020 [Dissulfurispira thermophila]
MDGLGKILKQAREILKNGSSRLISECEGLTAEKNLHEIAISWLKKALTEHGIGAKTAVGYGYFEKT